MSKEEFLLTNDRIGVLKEGDEDEPAKGKEEGGKVSDAVRLLRLVRSNSQNSRVDVHVRDHPL